ncbi:MAG: 2Fe-2S iron-sulfur cluster binding domain-containing protein [Streptosporangiales bacterium]|nr:2Fe-2S iron-sulfur cluster binding domain-containing protein [Streptosporangiales bacterium]
MVATVELRVNGRVRRVEAEADTALLYVLRNDFGLYGTRFGCGLNLCGACHVLVDGRVVASCDTPLWAVEGKEITTVEGLPEDGVAGALRRAFLDEQAAQCGICVSGIMVSAVGLLNEEPDPSEERIRAALDGNLCRCGAQPRMLRAIRRAAAENGAGGGGGES